uniref:Serine aminopeptidase S33 domain-containing protein n=1 Tax=Kalanchoe fedtschenkoi TaxID=63787 RepID=A0A7N0TL66_KALFE
MAHETGNVVNNNVKYEEDYITNSRGMKLFTCSWNPTQHHHQQHPKALIFFCHGYAMECSVSMKDTGMRLATAGYAVHGIDYEGHGKSAGLLGFINNMDCIVHDCTDHFTNISEREGNSKKVRFLLGESMGGAIALLIHQKMPQFWDGAILVAPMCKIADEVKPSPAVAKALSRLARIIPTWKIVPTPNDVVDAAFRLPETRMEIRENPYCYKGRPRLKTAYELMRVSTELENNLHKIQLPFLVVHGECDIVTDPSVSQLLYEKASSTDKTFKLYPGMWHSLLYGETPENVNTVFTDIISWLDEKCAFGRSRLEREIKHSNEQNSKTPFSKQ